MTEPADGTLARCELCGAFRRVPHPCRVEALQARVRELTDALEGVLDGREGAAGRAREVLDGR